MTSLAPLSASDRTLFRRELRQKRRALSASQQKIAARHLAQHLATLATLQQARRIALYWPVDGEIDPRGLARLALFSRHAFYLPVLQAFPAGTLRFAAWPRRRRLHRNRFKIPEPRGCRTLPAEKMDAILLPLTGFDLQGNRLGMGGGFYDRTLAFKRRGGQQSTSKPLLIGVAHACQQVPKLPAADWDVGLSLVVTDKKIFR